MKDMAVSVSESEFEWPKDWLSIVLVRGFAKGGKVLLPRYFTQADTGRLNSGSGGIK